MAEFERLIVQIFLSLIPVVGLYFSMKDRATKQENRLTVLEKDIENLNEFKKSANKRLDNHDEQNKAILVLAEQVKSLGEDVRELKTLIQSKT
nr:MAG TPA: nucleoporin [Caudoviricetes sp.]